MFNITNDAFYEYDSSEDGNFSGKSINTAAGIKEIDLGISDTVRHLIALKLDLQHTADRLSGVNEDREGLTAASSTATNAQSSIRASRTITQPMFYAFGEFEQIVLKKIIDKTKMVWGLGDSKEAQVVLGDKIAEFVQVTKDIAYNDYDVFLNDGRKEAETKDMILNLSQAAINTRELRVQDVMRVALSETVAEQLQILDNAWVHIKEVEAQNAQAQAKAMTEKSQQAYQTAVENREDMQKHDERMLILEKNLDREAETQKVSNQYILDRNKNGFNMKPEGASTAS